MSISKLEAFLARIYVDHEARERCLCDPAKAALSAGLSPDEIEALRQIDRVGLELFVDSLDHKRRKRASKHSRT